jgi:adenine-specific DNA glycosylase
VSGPPILDEQGFRAAVMSRMALRDLPWRRTRDPWAVLVAELMLQQTQVPRVEPKWRPPVPTRR